MFIEMLQMHPKRASPSRFFPAKALIALAAVLALVLTAVWMPSRPLASGGGLVPSHECLSDSLLLPGQAVLERPSASPGDRKVPLPDDVLAASAPHAFLEPRKAFGLGVTSPRWGACRRHLPGRPRGPPLTLT